MWQAGYAKVSTRVAVVLMPGIPAMIAIELIADSDKAF
jgi:hypothetical protein